MNAPTSGPRVIVNADDLGLSAKVNDATFGLIEAGRVTSATMIANADVFEEAATRAKQYRNCSFGVHLNLTQFAPLSAGAKLDGFLDGDGQLSSTWRSRPLRPSLLSAAYDELCAQIERVRSALGDPSHVDSHHHVHTSPALFPVLAALVRKYRIRKVRISRNLFEPDDAKSSALLLKKRIWNFALRHATGVRTTDYFGDLVSLVGQKPLGDCTVEVMVHPGHDDYARENDLLANDWRARLPEPASLISYREF